MAQDRHSGGSGKQRRDQEGVDDHERGALVAEIDEWRDAEKKDFGGSSEGEPLQLLALDAGRASESANESDD